MRQLTLALAAEKPQTLASFVTGRNAELLQLLQEFAAAAGPLPRERFVYLWGESGAGKSHLLHALALRDNACYLPADATADAFVALPKIKLYLLDDCDQLSPANQVAAFALYNQIKENGGLLVAAGKAAPLALALREDLRTRLGWGLVYQLHGLSDDEKIAALNGAAQAGGLNLSPGVLPYLITHYRRDMRSLSAMLDALDRYSLETQRPITLPLLRSLLQVDGKPDNTSSCA